MSIHKLETFHKKTRDPRGYIVTVTHLPDGSERKLLTFASTATKARQEAQRRIKKSDGLDLSMTVKTDDGKYVRRFNAVLRTPPPLFAWNKRSSWRTIRATRDIDARVNL